MINFIVSDTYIIVVMRVVVSATVITRSAVIITIISTAIRTIMVWFRIVEVIYIRIINVNTEVPSATAYIDRTIEIVHSHKLTILVVR